MEDVLSSFAVNMPLSSGFLARRVPIRRVYLGYEIWRDYEIFIEIDCL